MDSRGTRGVRARRRGDRADRRGPLALNRLCLDTSAYSRFKRGDAAVVELVDAAAWIGIPSIVVGELLAGFLAGDRGARNLEELELFLQNPVVEALAVDRDVAQIYAEVVTALRRSGTPIPTNDIWIAATAARAGAALVAYDVHFAAVDRVGTILLEDA